jgi:dienelactone hydrolase
MLATTESISSGGRPIHEDLYLPKSTAKARAVLILHGTFGLLPPFGADIASFGEALAQRSIAAIIPRYFESTGTDAGEEAMKLIGVHLPTWRIACNDALVGMAADARFDGKRLGIIGFSLGGHLALSLALQPPATSSVKCVVDFFGPTVVPPLEGDFSKLPPVLIQHGTDDRVVNISESKRLVDRLAAAGKTELKDYEFVPYKGQGHGFTGVDLTISREAAVAFIEKRL